MRNAQAIGLVAQSPLLLDAGFRHGFSLRGGGVSEGPFASLNLGRAVGDAPAAVAENHRRLAAAVGYHEQNLFEVSQVHGARCICTDGEAPQALRQQEADALTTTIAGNAVGVRTADCLPVLVASTATGEVAAVHAGWRGVVAGIAGKVIATLRQAAGRDVRLLAAIGPHIRQCCFEVGEEVATALADVCPDAECASAAICRSKTKPHVSLHHIVHAQLLAAGVAHADIDSVSGCTHCEPERFFSYRRDGSASGRHLSVIVARPSAG